MACAGALLLRLPGTGEGSLWWAWTLLWAFALFNVLMVTAGLLVYAERKVCARIQNRIGPNRVGPAGILQWIADAVKLFLKEDIVPDHVNRFFYIVGPFMAFFPGMVVFGVMPFGTANTADPGAAFALASLDVGLVFVVALTSIAVYGVAYGGWASNNKFSLLGGLRSSAQLISYEIPMGLALISLIMSAGSLSLPEIVTQQQGTFLGFLPNWYCFHQPVAFLIFWVCAFAEGNRLPFDLPEAEPELVGGYHTEYSSMKFGMFFLGEYAALASMAAFVVTLFLGGWALPYGVEAMLTPGWQTAAATVGCFLVKWALLLFVYLWVRWTLPRFRYDQLMRLGWKGLLPLALANIFVTGVLAVR
ncbi:MAG: NADH-quinone oxidoreductase subunit NuoH [Planctomycetes bacterium]|nr:NADH-quinone oxidoreductase subunit NuoH [Planctomycetota bacterium]